MSDDEKKSSGTMSRTAGNVAVIVFYIIQILLIAPSIAETVDARKRSGTGPPSFEWLPWDDMTMLLIRGAGASVPAILGMICSLGGPKGAAEKWPLFFVGLAMWLVISFSDYIW
jgi:hypothetical protein